MSSVEYHREYYRKNKERLLALNKKRRQARLAAETPEQCEARRKRELASTKRWQAANPEKVKAADHNRWATITDEQRSKRNEGHRKRYQSNKPRANAQSKAWAAAHPEERRRIARDSHLQRKFGITLDEFRARLAAQGGGCAICGIAEVEAKMPLRLDHDHTTGAHRDILCHHCNAGLGLFRDRPELLRKAACYMEKHGANSVPV